jgi:hypothetical protein
MHLRIHAKWLANACRSAGRPFGSAAHFVDGVTGAIRKDISKIPIAGPLFTSILDLVATPLEIESQLLQGKRIDKVFVDRLKSDLKDIKEVGPYAQMVISLVPGVGPVVSGAIGATMALAEGQPIDDVLIAGLKGMVPGGPLGAAAFGAAVGAVSAVANKEPLAEGITRTLMDAIPLPGDAQVQDAMKRAMTSAVNATGAIAHGEKPGVAVLAALDQNIASIKDLPGMNPEAAKALTTALGTGMAMAMAKVTQKTLTTAITPAVLDKLFAIGQTAMAGDTTIQAASKATPKGQHGFLIGVGLMSHQIGIHSFSTVRDQLKGDDKKGFDIGVALHVGRVATIPSTANPATAAGAAIANGIRGAGKDNTVAVIAAVATDPAMKAGVEQAVASMPMYSKRTVATASGIVTMGLLGLVGMSALPVIGLGALAAGAGWMLSK